MREEYIFTVIFYFNLKKRLLFFHLNILMQLKKLKKEKKNL